VLIVDDNRDAANSLGMLLSLMSAEVAVAHDGASALEILPKHLPTIVLLDIGMPGMDGFEVARRIRAHAAGQQVRLVALTGWGQESDRYRIRESGFDLHLVKPADTAAIEALLAT
jgi:DNA-binding response OmpR family regulator